MGANISNKFTLSGNYLLTTTCLLELGGKSLDFYGNFYRCIVKVKHKQIRLTSLRFVFSFPPESTLLRRNDKVLKRFSNLCVFGGKFERVVDGRESELDELDRRSLNDILY